MTVWRLILTLTLHTASLVAAVVTGLWPNEIIKIIAVFGAFPESFGQSQRTTLDERKIDVISSD